MNSIPVANARNLAVLGHTSSGKTTLIDALMFKLGVNDRLGSVDNGSSIADYTDEEKARNITIFAKPFAAAAKTGGGQDVALSVIDTPGYMDFFGQVVAACHAAETALICVDAVARVQVGTRQAFKAATRRGMAKAVVITGLDRENADYARTLADVQEAFGSGCVPVVLPLPDGSGVVDILAARDVPEAVAAAVEEAKGALVERAAETDDTLIEKFLGGEDLSPDEIAAGLRAAVAGGNLVPVFVALPQKELGIDTLIDGIYRLLPSPLDVPVRDEEDHAIDPGPEAPLVAFVWRTVTDPFVGQLTFVRVLGGTLKGDSEVFNATRGQKERVGSLLRVNGKQQDTVADATAGDIVALPKLKATGISDTLCAPGQAVKLAPMVFPKPVIFQTVTAQTQADEDKIGTALQRVCDEDPTLHVERNAATRETVLQGLGDVHIDVAVGLMKSRSNVSVTLSTPKVPYRETVTAIGEGHYRHKKQSGGRGQFGEVFLRVSPLPEGDEEWFVDAVVGGAIPGNFLPAVQKGLVEGQERGAVAGYPVTKVKITVYDGKYHDVDSSEIAFKIAGSRALRDGMSKAKPVLLEPIMTVKVFVPDQYMGDINGDLNHKRGRILGMGNEDGLQVITAEVPQAELFRYAAELRSMTGGQGSFEMEFARYEQVPANIAQKVIDAAEKVEDDE